MPRERIQHGKQYVWGAREEVPPGQLPGAGKLWLPGMPLHDGQMLREEPSLDLHWNLESAGGWVQLSINSPRDFIERWYESYSGSPEQHHFPLLTNVLSRDEINKLIKTLRRARDSAYGKDE